MATILTANSETIARGAEIIRAGGLVAFPTETVYGLGANALDSDAVRRIFEAKGRPANNPLIVHIGQLSDLALLARENASADALIERFWPGPLTLVFPKQPAVPDIVTAGGSTVAVRMPDHPVALALLQAASLPIAAPSANRSEQISPTSAEHVAAGLGDAVDIILDGGPCAVGLESTVLDMTCHPPRLLRPGMISKANIEAALGTTIAGPEPRDPGGAPQPVRSPGQMSRHYAPQKPMYLVEDVWTLATGRNVPVAVLAYSSHRREMGPDVHVIQMSAEPGRYAAELYAALHKADGMPGTEIWVETVPPGERWQAIEDRLKRAAAPHRL